MDAKKAWATYFLFGLVVALLSWAISTDVPFMQALGIASAVAYIIVGVIGAMLSFDDEEV